MEKVQNLFANMAREARGLWVPEEIKSIYSIDSITFLREFVARNVPVVVRNGCKHWDAMSRWNRDYFKKTIKQKVTVAKSDGNADCLKVVNNELYFCLPFESEMTMAEFYNYKSRDNEVLYIQKQCSSLKTEMPELLNDIEELNWASEAFGIEPDATNIWIGNMNAVSSLHKDPYENIYCVVTGRKQFTLLPPTDLPFLYRSNYKTAHFNSNLDIVTLQNESRIPWVPVDPDNPNMEQFPLFKHASPLNVTLYPGDVLYLPALWYHKVKQDDETVAVNFWYDMQFDSRWTWDGFATQLLSSM